MARFTAAEDAALRRLFPEHGADWDGWADALPGRSVDSIRNRAGRIGVRKAVRKDGWTAEEDAELRRWYPSKGPRWAGWAAVLHGRSGRAIVLRAFRLGIGVLNSARSAHHKAAAMKREAARRAANGVQNGTPGKAPGDGAETRR